MFLVENMESNRNESSDAESGTDITENTSVNSGEGVVKFRV